jgi:hypothetical protein
LEVIVSKRIGAETIFDAKKISSVFLNQYSICCISSNPLEVVKLEGGENSGGFAVLEYSQYTNILCICRSLDQSDLKNANPPPIKPGPRVRDFSR